ncbi:3-dehydroquinate synthase [uncultured Polaribacter sp.]|uniref:3-dehydroquinate synthase n=1 Tax=uncultured Polaribacter sp. TaxID=174711 RepID=UPI002635C5BD|nr:3-dehydroquinate synthase [uncultured Polaribacter sp.]
MQTIQSTSYPVHFKEASYKALNAYLKNNIPSTIFILVDENTIDACLPKFMASIETTATIEIVEIESGEVNKNLTTCVDLWNVLTELGADRKSLLFNLGGGVITDMGGFVGSAYKRGITFINIPTTLLSMVDASVGGKTGVDLGVLKNQIGLFSDPEMVLIDPEYLKTVTPREMISGTAEIIKYGLTYDVRLWEKIKNNGLENIDFLLHRSIEIKNEVVLEDRLEANLRKILNFGHTIGHAVESYFLESEHKETLSHGEAIALGMITETYLSTKLFNFPKETLENIKNAIITIFGKVPILKEDYPAVLDLLKHDKKNVNGEVNFVLLSALETCEIDCKVSNDLIIESLNYYLS